MSLTSGGSAPAHREKTRLAALRSANLELRKTLGSVAFVAAAAMVAVVGCAASASESAEPTSESSAALCGMCLTDADCGGGHCDTSNACKPSACNRESCICTMDCNGRWGVCRSGGGGTSGSSGTSGTSGSSGTGAPGGSGSACCARFAHGGTMNCMPGPGQDPALRACCAIVAQDHSCHIAW